MTYFALSILTDETTGHRTGYCVLPMDQDTYTSLTRIGQFENRQLSAVLLACWRILLWRLTGEIRVVIGVHSDGRNEVGLKEAPGLFTTLLWISCELDGKRSF